MIEPNAHIGAMAAYALAEVKAPSGLELVSLSQNESLRPPSPHAIQAASEELQRAALYPDAGCSALRAALSELHGLPADDILCGAGSLDLIAALTRAYAGSGRAVLAPVHAYPFFRTAAEMAAARFDTAPETGWTVDVDALLAALRLDTKLVFVANPGNPTGTRLPRSELERLRTSLPDDVLLVIDEAYGEFCDGSCAPAWPLVKRSNCVILRTFSKAYGLAGARVGWGLFPRDVAQHVAKLLNPNGVSAASQAAALAALEDQAYMRETCDMTMRLREACRGRLQVAGFVALASHANFLLVDLGQPKHAIDLCETLAARGIILRRQQGAGAPHAVRVTIGPDKLNDTAIDAMIAWRKGRNS